MAKKEQKSWSLIIDSSYLCYKAFYTMPPTMSFKKHDTNIIFGFMNQLKKVMEEVGAVNRVIFCFDSAKSYRKMLDPEYKNRHEDKTPEEKEKLRIAKLQFVELEDEFLPKMGFKNIYSQTGYESDDIIAELCWRHPDDYIVVTNDEDLFQLLYQGPVREIKLYNTKKYTRAQDIVRAFGIEPIQWVQVKAIAGCKTDNVPGVEGVGDTKAIQYIRGDLPEGKIKARIQKSGDLISENMTYVALPHNGLVPLNIKEPVDDDLLVSDFMDTFRKYGFNSYMKQPNLDQWLDLFRCRAEIISGL